METLGLVIKIRMGHTFQDHCVFYHPYDDEQLLCRVQNYVLAFHHWIKNRLNIFLKTTHPSTITSHPAYTLRDKIRCVFWFLWPLDNPPVFIRLHSLKLILSIICYRHLLQKLQYPLWPYMFIRIGTTTTEYAKMCHGGLGCEEKAKDQERCGNSHPETRRLLQESEESRHAFTDQRNQEVTAQTVPSHLRGGYTATRTRSNNPEDVS